MKTNLQEANKIKKSIFKDLRDYMTSVKSLFPFDLQISISKRINLIYALGNKKPKDCWSCAKSQKCVRTERFDLKGCNNWVDEVDRERVNIGEPFSDKGIDNKLWVKGLNQLVKVTELQETKK